MNHRHAQLLSGLIERHVATGKPVGSRELTRCLGLTISPATVRSALQELDSADYLEQPHTSAGRTPTDKGYRFYVDNVVADPLLTTEQRRIQRAFDRLYHEHQHRCRTAAKLLAQLAHTVAISTAMRSSDMQEAGMSELLEHLDQDELDTAREVSMIVETINRDTHRLTQLAFDNSVVFIGRENPLLSAEYTSLLVRQVARPSGSPVLLVITGPKRMSYQRNLALLDYVAELI